MGPAKTMGSRGQGQPTSTALFLAPLPQGPPGDPKVRLVPGPSQAITVKVVTDTIYRQDIPSHSERKMPSEEEKIVFPSTDIRPQYQTSPVIPTKAGPGLCVPPNTSGLGLAEGGWTREGQYRQSESR